MSIDPTTSSPLAEAEPESLDLLFARLDSHIAARTLSLPNAQKDLGLVVEELRRQRASWAQAEAAGATRASPRAKKSPNSTTLNDLGLD